MKKEHLIIKSSWLGSHEYCEWKWYLENVLKEEVPRTKAMVKGSQIHQEKEDSFLEVAAPTTMEEFLASTTYTITKEIFLRKEYEDFILVGKIDELGIDKDNVYVIDDKPNAHPWLGTKRQIWAYCMLFKENFPKLKKKVIAVLRDRDSDVEVWHKDFEESDNQNVLIVFERMKQLAQKQIEPISCTVPAKCRACALHKQGKCEHSCG